MKVFGTDGVRGHANKFPMVPEIALALGRAAGKMFRSRFKGRSRVVIGKDTRLSCYMFENALIAGLCSMGIDTLMVGPLPTPGVAFITRAYRAEAGVVISASHNLFSDNGIKFFDSNGFKLPDALEEEIENYIAAGNFDADLPSDDGIGRNTKVVDADGRYIEFIKATFPRSLSLKNLKISVDCANGSAYKVAPMIFRELDAEVFATGITPNGLNINQLCGSTYPQTIQNFVKINQADVGISLDGDADRIIMSDENGNIVDGDVMLAICAQDMKQKGILRNNCVVATVMSNLGFLKAMEEQGIQVIRSQVGDRYVIQDMLKHDCNLGGEQSGHVIFLDHNTTGDGLVCALQVLRIMIERNMKLSELASIVKHYPQVCVNVKVKSKVPFESIKGLNGAIKNVETSLGQSGRLLIRYSGTENICRIMVEAASQKEADRTANSLAELVNQEIGITKG